jgi:hypothetical protein
MFLILSLSRLAHKVEIEGSIPADFPTVIPPSSKK